MNEAQALQSVARSEAEAARQRAQDWAARQTAAERGADPVVVPEGANDKQRATYLAAMGEIAMRERQSKIGRGWVRIAKRTAPAGSIPLCVLHGARTLTLAVDLRGSIRLVEAGRLSTPVSVSEAAAFAAGRCAD